jgi:hypothetical protein
MPEELEKETPVRRAPELASDGNAVPGGEGNHEEPFPYFLQIGDVYDGPLDVSVDPH